MTHGMTKTTRIGRPPKVTAEDIVQAALAIGLDQANIRNVAAALNMSPTGLYRHVRTREQLLDLVVDLAFAQALRDFPSEQSFEEHLLFFARRMFDLYERHPAAIEVVSCGYVLITEKITRILERIIDRGVRAGFSPVEAYDIWMRVMAAMLGAATVAASDRAMRRANTSFVSLLGATMEADRATAPRLRGLVTEGLADAGTDHFETVQIMLDGLRSRYAGRLESA